MANWLLRVGPWMTVGGAVSQLTGLALDARLHRLDPGLGAHEGIFTLANPGHALLALGLVLVVAGATAFLWGRAHLAGAWRPGRMLGAVSAVALLVFALAAFASALSTAPLPDHHRAGPAPSAAQLAAAADFVKATKAGTARFTDFRVARAEGYWQDTPFPVRGRYGPAHFHNDAYAGKAYAHPDRVDPARPPDLVYLKLADGRMLLLGAM